MNVTQSPLKWYLRLEDESVFGPVDLAEISKWAVDCRIGPDHEISTDQKTWRRAAEVPQLRMEWAVSLMDGELFGPIPQDAIRQLLEDGAVSAQSVAKNEKTGATSTVGRLLGIGEHAAAKPEHPPEAPKKDDEASQRAGVLERELKDARGKLAESAESLERERKDSAAARRKLEEDLAKSKAHAEGAAGQIATLTSGRKTSEEALAKAKSEFAAAQESHKKQLADAQKQRDELQARAEELEEETAKLKASAEKTAEESRQAVGVDDDRAGKLAAELEVANGELALSKTEREEERKQAAEGQAKLEAVRVELARASESLTREREEHTATRSDIETKLSEGATKTDVLSSQIAALTAEKKARDEELAKVQKDFAVERESQRQQFAAAQQKCDEAQARLKDQEAKLEEGAARVAELSGQFVSLTGEKKLGAEALVKARNELAAEQASHKQQLVAVQRKCDAHQAAEKEWEAKLVASFARVEELTGQMSALTDDKKVGEEALAKVRADLASADENHRTQLAAAHESAKQRKSELEQKIQAEQEQLAKEQKEHAATREKSESAISKSVARSEELSKKVADLIHEGEVLREELNRARADLVAQGKSHKTESVRWRNAREELQTRIGELEATIGELRAEREALQFELGKRLADQKSRPGGTAAPAAPERLTPPPQQIKTRLQRLVK